MRQIRKYFLYNGMCHAGCGASRPFFFHLSVILKEHKFRELDVFPSSCEMEGETSTQLGPLADYVQ
jgi:hypothetical protein